MNDKKFELAKIEIEKLKIKEGLTRTILILILTVGAGIGTISRIIEIPIYWYKLIFVGLAFILFIFSIYFLYLLIDIKITLRKLEKWKF